MYEILLVCWASFAHCFICMHQWQLLAHYCKCNSLRVPAHC
jgi:hypothetical protein